MYHYECFFFFFFQAEDGIRDTSVAGVQTCALPISGRRTSVSESDKGPDALIEQRGHTLILTLNRPEKRNALSTEMMSIMVDAWDRVDEDPEIRTCILTGAGGYFCAGMDLKKA